ncbi:MAG TPA: 30S ribosomal protein S24e [Candidatus Altiarchaeales archaeon]|nr:30S ribosomal protein S24e [Candidatus Altiarchaeales archaeon]
MRIEIIEKRENPLLNRKEIQVKILYEGRTPDFLKIKEEIVKKLKLNNNLTVLNSIETEFGKKSSNCYLKVYKDEESMKVEPEHRLKKNFEEEKPKEEETIDEDEKKGATDEEKRDEMTEEQNKKGSEDKEVETKKKSEDDKNE